MTKRNRLPSPRTSKVAVVVLALAFDSAVVAFTPLSPTTQPTREIHFTRPRLTRHFLSSVTDEATQSPDSTESPELQSEDPVIKYSTNEKKTSLEAVLSLVNEKIGTVDDDRLIFPEYESREVPRMFSSLEYTKTDQGKMSAKHAAGSVLGAAALVAGTTVGAGVLALPAATAAAGFVPSSVALISAWIYMTMSGLLVAELTLNRIGETGRPGLGLLELYENSLGKPWSLVGSAAYFFLHYAMMVAYIAQGGTNLSALLSSSDGPLGSLVTSVPGVSQVAFASVVGVALFSASPSVIEQVNNVMVLGVFAAFAGILALGFGGADFAALVDPGNQHPENVISCLPILFLALVYQNVVPTVVSQLEGDRTKITQAIVAGTTLPMLMFLAWNAIVLGNVVGLDMTDSNMDPVALLQSGAVGGDMLGPLVSTFSSLALVTSVIGFTYGLVDAWRDVFGINAKSSDYEKWKISLFGLVFAPPLALSVANPDIFFGALDYGGAFGVSTLFLVLPPIMVWNQRYSQVDKPLMTKPMVPLGKVPLGSMWKVAGMLILEQGSEKLGVVDFLREHFLSQ